MTATTTAEEGTGEAAGAAPRIEFALVRRPPRSWDELEEEDGWDPGPDWPPPPWPDAGGPRLTAGEIELLVGTPISRWRDRGGPAYEDSRYVAETLLGGGRSSVDPSELVDRAVFRLPQAPPGEMFGYGRSEWKLTLRGVTAGRAEIERIFGVADPDARRPRWLLLRLAPGAEIVGVRPTGLSYHGSRSGSWTMEFALAKARWRSGVPLLGPAGPPAAGEEGGRCAGTAGS